MPVFGTHLVLNLRDDVYFSEGRKDLHSPNCFVGRHCCRRCRDAPEQCQFCVSASCAPMRWALSHPPPNCSFLRSQRSRDSILTQSLSHAIVENKGDCDFRGQFTIARGLARYRVSHRTMNSPILESSHGLSMWAIFGGPGASKQSYRKYLI
jgi:hypothetical protein